MPTDRLPIVNRFALGLLGVIAVSLVIVWINDGWGEGRLLFDVWCAAYTAGLAWGWWRLRSNASSPTAYVIGWVLLLAQLMVYALLWMYVAWDPPDGALAHPSWGPDLSLIALALAFFIVGPLAAILIASVGRNGVVLVFAETLGPFSFAYVLAAG